LPPTLPVAGQELGLAGCAPREVLWRDVYALGLYLPRAQTTVGYIRDPSTAKALRLKVAYEGDVPDELPDKWQEALRRAYSQDLVRTLQGHYRTLKTGDTLTASYAPGRDTTILLNGEPIISKPGHGLMDALLGLWIGRDPVSEDMRREILAGGC
jgi:hypothetical protein